MENSVSESSEGENKENNKEPVEVEADSTEKVNILKSAAIKLAETSTSDSQKNENVLKNGTIEEKPECIINFTVVYNKVKHEVTFDANKTVKDLKDHLHTLICVPQSLQKVMIKGLAKDDQTLNDLDVKSGSKVMVVGSKLDQILALSSGPSKQEAAEEKASGVKEPFCKQKMHKKILDKGIPDDVMVGIRNSKDPLPSAPLSGMLNKGGGKVRLAFRLELDQVWISTKERTDKIAMNSIKSIVNEPIEGHEEYHIVGMQLGTTEASRYWLYWVPAQYVDALKNTILGTWMI